MANKIQRGTSSNLLEDKKLAIGEQFVPPVKDDFTDDETGSLAFGNSERLKAKGSDGVIREIANLEDVVEVTIASLPTPSDETFIII